jgi:hypothetical protein
LAFRSRCAYVWENMRWISLRNNPFLWTISRLPRCIFLIKQSKRDSYISHLWHQPDISARHTHTYIHTFIENHIRLIWLTSSILTPDALFAHLSWCISYASCSALHLLIIQMIFFFPLSIIKKKNVWKSKDVSS